MADRLPAVLHLTNILLHMAATGLVYFLAARVLRGRKFAPGAACLAAFLFAFHPVHVESVCSVAGRTDILAAVFLLGSTLLALRFDETEQRGRAFVLALGSSVFFLMALLSKENAVVHVLVLPLFLYAVRRWEGDQVWGRVEARRSLILFVPMAAAVGVYFFLRTRAGIVLADSTPTSPTALADIFSALALCLWKTLIPWPNNHHISTLPPLWAALAVVFSSGALLGAAAWRFPRGRWLLSAALVWYLATLAPSLVLAARRISPTLTAERYLYLPSVAAALLAGALAAWALEKHRKAALAVGVVLLAAFGAGSFLQSRVWLNDVSFWESVVHGSDNARDADALNGLGEAYRNRGRFDEAIEMFRRSQEPGAVASKHSHTQTVENMSAAYFGRGMEKLNAGRAAEALADVETGLGILAPEEGALQGDATFLTLQGTGRLVKACVLERFSGSLNPQLLREAYRYLQQARQLDPHNSPAAENLVRCEALLKEAQGR
jgi:tetratricopeptide (TPR) repeat protein